MKYDAEKLRYQAYTKLNFMLGKIKKIYFKTRKNKLKNNRNLK